MMDGAGQTEPVLEAGLRPFKYGRMLLLEDWQDAVLIETE